MTTLVFQNKTLSAIHQQNQIWLSATEIGNALGYSHPIQNVTKIYERHQDEFTPCMTQLVEMQTAGGMQKVRIFSLRGCHLIGMLSHTKVAKEFRRWVLDILDKEIGNVQNSQPNLPLEEIQQDEEALHIIVNLFHSLNGAYEMGRILCQREKHLAQEISKQVGEHYLYNLNFPTQNALDKARKYIHAKSERIMFVKGMLSLLDEPTHKRIVNN